MTHILRALLAVLLVLPGAGHAVELLQSYPKAGAVLSDTPQEVRLWFDVEPMTDSASLRIVGTSGTIEVHHVHTMGEQDLMGFVATDMVDGGYQLEWQVGGKKGSVPFAIRRVME